MKILIVDDNLAIRKVLSALLEQHGHQVVAALEDGSRLSECIEQHSPDLVCLDYNLPGRNGLEILADLHSSTPEIAVFMVTGSADPTLVGRAADAGAAGFLHKPFSKDQILEELAHLDEARRLTAKATGDGPMLDLRIPEQSRRTALIVDDSGAIRLLLKGILEGIGLKVLQTVASGHEAIEAAKRYLPEVVTLDVDMPGMTGLAALPLIHDVSPQSKIVMVTGNADKALVQQAVAGGAKGYILKPLRPAHVEAFMKKLLG